MQNGAGGADRSRSTPSLEDAARALDAMDACLLGLLPVTGQGADAATWPTPEQAAQRAEALVDASATISRALSAFGRAGPTAADNGGVAGVVDERRARSSLRRAIAGLEAEVRNADALLERSRSSVARWRASAEATKGAIDQSLALPGEGGGGNVGAR